MIKINWNKLGRVLLLTTTVAGAAVSSSRVASAAGPIRQALPSHQAELEAIRGEVIQALGFDPWPPERMANFDRKLFHRIALRLQEVHACIERKEGKPSQADEDISGLSREQLVQRLGFDPWPEDLEATLSDRSFWERLASTLRDLTFRCGEPLDPAIIASFSSCNIACQVGFNACISHRTEFGPPWPSGLDRCDWRNNFCQTLCIFGV